MYIPAHRVCCCVWSQHGLLLLVSTWVIGLNEVFVCFQQACALAHHASWSQHGLLVVSASFLFGVKMAFVCKNFIDYILNAHERYISFEFPSTARC